MIYDAAVGIGLGNSAISIDRMEASVRQGHNHYLTTLFQTLQLNTTLTFANVALDKAGQDSFSWTTHLVTLAAPAALSYALSTEIEDGTVRDIVLFAHDNVSNLSKLVDAVSFVAMIYFGSVITPALALSFYAIGVLDQQGILPEGIRQTLHKGSFFIGAATGLFYGGPISQMSCAIGLTIYVAYKYFEFQYPGITPVVHEDQRSEPLTHETLPSFLQDFSPALSVNRGHVDYPTLPPIPNVELTTLYTLCDEIPWENHLNALQRKLAQDLRWTEREQREGGEIEYLNRELRSFVDSIVNHRILQGEPGNYETMKSYLKIITSILPDQDEITQADALITLAVEGSEYCGPGKFRVVADVYSSLVAEAADLPYRTKILQSLEQFRMSVFQGIYNEIWNGDAISRAVRGIIDFQDIHAFNQVVIYGGSSFGLPNQGAADDETISESPFVRVLMNSIYEPMQQLFWEGGIVGEGEFFEGYTDDSIVAHLREQIGTPLLPAYEFYAWWNEWIERQSISDERKVELQEGLGHIPPQLFGVPLEVDDVIQDRFIEAMLVDIGVFRR